MSRKLRFAILLSVGTLTLSLLRIAVTGLNSLDVALLSLSTVVLCWSLWRTR